MDRILARFREVLHGLGLEDDQIDGHVGALSGGRKMRVVLAKQGSVMSLAILRQTAPDLKRGKLRHSFDARSPG